MLKQVAIIAGSTAGLMALAPVANAEGGGDINVANDNNLIVAPVQVCGVTVAGGDIATIASPQTQNCINAPLTDHPTTYNH